MPVITQVQTNFTGGELSPKAAARLEAERYNNSAKKLINCIPLNTGGVIRRPGTRMVAQALDSDIKPKLISYVFNESQAYVLEFSDEKMRVYHDGALVDFELAVPYSAEDLEGIGWTRSGDSLYLLHRDYPPHRIQRWAHDFWRIEEVAFDPMPYAEIGHRLSATLTLSAATTGTGRTFTSSAESFLESDVGRVLVAGRGKATITAYTSKSVVVGTITAAFESTTATGATLQGTPLGALKPQTDAQDLTVGTEITLESSAYLNEPEKIIRHLTGDGAGTVTATLVDHGYDTSDEINVWGYNIFGFPPPQVNGTYTITKDDADTFHYSISAAYPSFDEPDNGHCKRVSGAGAAVHLFRPEDVGSYILINGGLIKITRFDTSSKVAGTMVRVVTSDIAAAPNAWILSQPAWNATDGYPRAGTFYQQRLILAGSKGFPHTIWASEVGFPHSFELWTTDDAALSFAIALDEINPILHLASHKALIAFTAGSEVTIQGGLDNPLTIEQTSYGANGVRPHRVGNELLFVQRGGVRVRAVAYRFEQDAFVAPDLAWIAEHLTGPGIAAMAYQDEPWSTLWAVTTEGKLLSLTLDRDEKMVAWAEHETDGTIDDVCVIPNGTDSQLWLATKRTIRAETVRFIELMDPSLNTDCAVVHDGSPSTSWACAHLEDKEVDVVEGYLAHGSFVVDDGYVTLDQSASTPEIGLHYTTTVHTHTPQIEAEQTNHGAAMRNVLVILRLHETIGASVNGTQIPFGTFDGEHGDPDEPYTGDVRLETLGWEKGNAELIIEQTQPLPFHLLGIIRRYAWND